jgi:hypothetical protein
MPRQGDDGVDGKSHEAGEVLTRKVLAALPFAYMSSFFQKAVAESASAASADLTAFPP